MSVFSDRPLAYVRIAANSTGAYRHLCQELLGCEAVDVRSDYIAFRCDERARSIVAATCETQDSIGLELQDEAALEHARERLTAAGIAYSKMAQDCCADRSVRAGLSVDIDVGCRIELVVGAAVTARRFYPNVDTGLTGMTTVGLRSAHIDRDLHFWSEALGARIGDRVGEIAYLRLDGAHHRIAIYPSAARGILYVGLGVRSLDHLMQTAYGLQERQIRVVHGPGCETASGRVFVRFRADASVLFSLEFDDRQVRPDWIPRHFERTAEALCAWGSKCTDVQELVA